MRRFRFERHVDENEGRGLEWRSSTQGFKKRHSLRANTASILFRFRPCSRSERSKWSNETPVRTQSGSFFSSSRNEYKLNRWETGGCYSRTLLKEQHNYSVSEKEFYAVVWSVLALRRYSDRSHFKVRTDHAALKKMLMLNDPTGQLPRSRLRFMKFEYEIIYRSFRVHQMPDALSRSKLNFSTLMGTGAWISDLRKVMPLTKNSKAQVWTAKNAPPRVSTAVDKKVNHFRVSNHWRKVILRGRGTCRYLSTPTAERKTIVCLVGRAWRRA